MMSPSTGNDVTRVTPTRRTIEAWSNCAPSEVDYRSEFDSPSAHERMNELAAIFATGIHRLRAIHSALPEWAQSPADSSPVGLDQGRQLALMEPGLQPESEELDDVH